jgi:hypothetical protein
VQKPDRKQTLELPVLETASQKQKLCESKK